MAKIRSEELDQLAGEVLPERTVLSVMPAVADGALFSPFCSQNNQSNALSGVSGGANQCGLTNTAHADGVALITG